MTPLEIDLWVLLQLMLILFASGGFILLYKMTKWGGWLFFSASVLFILIRVLLIFFNVIMDLDLIYNILSISADIFRLVGVVSIIWLLKKSFNKEPILSKTAYEENLAVATKNLENAKKAANDANNALTVARVTLDTAHNLLVEKDKNGKNGGNKS